MPLFLIILAILGGGTLLVRNATKPKALPPGIVPQGSATLTPQHWYRVKGMTTAAIIDDARKNEPEGETQKALQRDLTSDLETLGFTNTKLAMQDPSEPLIWRFITQWGKPNSNLGVSPLGKIQVVSVEEVETPPVTIPRPESPSNLEAGIPYDEAHAVAYALARDNDPKHLQYFADSMMPDFPLSAGLLLAKMKLETAITDGRGQLQEAAPVAELKRLTQGLGKAVEGLWNKYVVNPAVPQVPPAAQASGIFCGANLQGLTIEQLVTGVDKLGAKGEKEIRLMLSKLVKTPSAASLPSSQLAIAFGIDEMSAKAALASITRLARDIVVVEPDIMRRILPSSPPNISVTAIHLVQATRTAKAEVTDPKVAVARLKEVNKAAAVGDAQALLAKEQLARATKALDRRKWIENYRRIEEGQKLPAMEAPIAYRRTL